MTDPPSAGGSSGDELEDLLLAELEEQAELDAATAPIENEQKDAPSQKRQKTVGASSRSGECPPHPGFMGGICIRCGALKPPPEIQHLTQHLPGSSKATDRGNSNIDNANPSTAVALKYIHHGLEVSREEADRIRGETVQRALTSRRLQLILDLDHTLLHSSRFSDLTEAQHEQLHKLAAAQTGSSETFSLYHIQYMQMWTKFRPGLHKFLASAHELFDLHVFTMGDKDYAAGMAAILDPNGKFFGGRVASSSDAGPGGVKDIDVLLGAEEMVLILDDTVGVWPRHKDNLMQVERYIYFPGDAVRFGKGRSFFELGQDEDPENGTLATCLRVLTEVHRRFFEQHDTQQQEKLLLKSFSSANREADGTLSLPDVRAILRAVRAETLAGCCILFSRIFGKDDPDPSRNEYWQMATKFGARCVTEQCPEVTHVVAGSHTEKTNWAEGLGKLVVSKEWLLCCSYTWTHLDEARYPVVADGGKPGTLKSSINDAAADLAAALAAAGGGGKP